MSSVLTIIESCRLCRSSELEEVLAFGPMPLANAYPRLDDEMPEERFPLTLVFCRTCSLLQLRESIAPDRLFSDYLYLSSYADSMQSHVRTLGARLISERDLDSSSLVVEAGSNDGYFLRFFKEKGIGVLGLEPAANVAKVAETEQGVPTRSEFLSLGLGKRLADEGHRADVFLALNVLAHVPDPNEFVQAVALILKADGIAIFEVPYVREMVDRCEFDTVYHEHLCYFSALTLRRLMENNGLRVCAVEPVPIHGGSLRVTVVRDGSQASDLGPLLRDEGLSEVGDLSYYIRFAERVLGVRKALREKLHALTSEGATIAAYGAAAKGTVLLNYCGIDGSTIEFVADRNPWKQGRRMPGCRIPIVDPKAISEKLPDYLLILIWNLAAEVMQQQGRYREGGGRFILPISEFTPL